MIPADLAHISVGFSAPGPGIPTSKAAPVSINQALAAVTLLFARAGLRITVKRARVPKPDALTKTGQGSVERAAARRGVRDRAIVATLLYAGARAGECGRLDAGDVTLTARTGHIRLHGKGDEVRTVPLPPVGREHLAAWLDERGTHDGPLWTGQRGRLTISGIDAGTPVPLRRQQGARHPELQGRPARDVKNEGVQSDG